MRGGSSAASDRGEGLRELGRALALDPSRGALELLSEVVLEGTDELPPEAEEELRKVALADRADASRRALWVFAVMIVFALVAFGAGLRFGNLATVAWSKGTLAVLSAASLLHLWMVRTGRTEPRNMRVAILLTFVSTAMIGLGSGPFLFAPIAALLTSASFMVALRATRETRGLITMLAVASIVVPYALERIGLTTRTMWIADDAIHFRSRVFAYADGWTEAALLLNSLGLLVAAALLVGRSVERMGRAERRNFALAHRLRQLLPAAERPGKEPPGPRT
jgi:hypothetical protein